MYNQESQELKYKLTVSCYKLKSRVSVTRTRLMGMRAEKSPVSAGEPGTSLGASISLSSGGKA
jgi:hypothetical protein